MREPRRTTGLAVAAVALLAMTAGCSDDGKKKATSTPSPLTSAQAQALASAAVLTEADMPGYSAEKQTHDADDDAMDARVATCLGLAKPAYVARDFGTGFTKGDLEIDSSADVAPSAAVAKTELAALTGSKAEGCLRTEFESLVSSSGGRVTSFEITPVTIDVPGADGSFGYKMEFSATAGGQRIAFSGYDVGSLVGPVEIDISVIDSSGGSGFSLDAAVALLKTVTDRAKAAA